MAVGLFLLPIVDVQNANIPLRGGKYGMRADHAEVIRGSFLKLDADDTLGLIQAPQAYLDTVAGQLDAVLLADASTIDAVITPAQAAAFAAELESRSLPAQWLTAGMTRREAIRTMAGIGMVSQRMLGRRRGGLKATLARHGMTLDSTWADIPQAMRRELLDIADDFGWDDLGLGATSTVREILKAMSDQFASTPMTIGPLTL